MVPTIRYGARSPQHRLSSLTLLGNSLVFPYPGTQLTSLAADFALAAQSPATHYTRDALYKRRPPYNHDHTKRSISTRSCLRVAAVPDPEIDWNAIVRDKFSVSTGRNVRPPTIAERSGSMQTPAPSATAC